MDVETKSYTLSSIETDHETLKEHTEILPLQFSPIMVTNPAYIYYIYTRGQSTVWEAVGCFFPLLVCTE